MSYPKEQVEFLQAVQDMRDAQREYFKQPNDYRLRVSIQRERKVDLLLKPYLDTEVIKPATKPITNQNSLF